MSDFVEFYNPLDAIAFLFSDQDWTFKRVHDHLLCIEIASDKTRYSLSFLWNEEEEMLVFECAYNFKIKPLHFTNLAVSLMHINKDLEMGGFVLTSEQNVALRYCVLMNDQSSYMAAESMAVMVEYALDSCEKHAHTFVLLMTDKHYSAAEQDLALMNVTALAA
jgi:hypothetical protein